MSRRKQEKCIRLNFEDGKGPNDHVLQKLLDQLQLTLAEVLESQGVESTDIDR